MAGPQKAAAVTQRWALCHGGGAAMVELLWRSHGGPEPQHNCGGGAKAAEGLHRSSGGRTVVAEQRWQSGGSRVAAAGQRRRISGSGDRGRAAAEAEQRSSGGRVASEAVVGVNLRLTFSV